jgi:hypothetical protein
VCNLAICGFSYSHSPPLFSLKQRDRVSILVLIRFIVVLACDLRSRVGGGEGLDVELVLGFFI